MAVHVVLLVFALFVCIEALRSDVCYFQDFRAQCPSQHVVFMESALYGRMQPGKCSFTDSFDDYSHCTVNVLSIADQLCSGKTQCQFRIPNQDIDALMVAECQVKGYFEGSFQCLPVTDLSRACQGTRSLQLTSHTIHISSADIASVYCARQEGSIVLQAKPGQQINVTLIDFMWGQSEQDCINYGTVVDHQTGRKRTICGGQQRTTELMVSISSSVYITPDSGVGNYRFLFKLQALGCPDLKPPLGAWMNRSLDELTIGCLANRDAWHLRCYGEKWVGDKIGSCPYAPIETEKPRYQSAGALPNDIIIALIAAATFLLAVTIVTVGTIYFKRAQRRQNELQKQQKQIVLTLTRRKPSENMMEESTYASPDLFTQPQPQPSTRPDSAYESIQLFNRTLPLPPPPVQSATMPNNARREDDSYNTSQSSSSTYARPQKYYVLDKNLVPPSSA